MSRMINKIPIHWHQSQNRNQDEINKGNKD